ncbi:MAG: DUF3006 domain-containing protein [Ruminococcus sp.]|nr:DUF3006 domain-containing protein [Ruminococcus sp.]
MNVIIDRLEGDLAVVILDEKTYNIPRALIPEAREGDTVEITVSGRVPSKGAESPHEIFERLRQNSRKKE